MNEVKVAISKDGITASVRVSKSAATKEQHDMFEAGMRDLRRVRWVRERKAWVFPMQELSVVRELEYECYGYSDIPDDRDLTVWVSYREGQCASKDAVYCFGKTVSRAAGMESGAVPGTDVKILSGKIDSGGTMERWGSFVCPCTEAMLYNVSRDAYERDLKQVLTYAYVEIIEERAPAVPEEHNDGREYRLVKCTLERKTTELLAQDKNLYIKPANGSAIRAADATIKTVGEYHSDEDALLALKRERAEFRPMAKHFREWIGTYTEFYIAEALDNGTLGKPIKSTEMREGLYDNLGVFVQEN